MIDAQLAAAGWVVQDRGEMNRSAAMGVAVREYPLRAGPCDYLLLVGRQGLRGGRGQGGGQRPCRAWPSRRPGYQAGRPPPGQLGRPASVRLRGSSTEILFTRPRRSRAAVAPSVRLPPARDAACLAEGTVVAPRAARRLAAARSPTACGTVRSRRSTGWRPRCSGTTRAPSCRWRPAPARPSPPPP